MSNDLQFKEGPEIRFVLEEHLIKANKRIAELEAKLKDIPQTFIDWSNAILKERERIAALEAEQNESRACLYRASKRIEELEAQLNRIY